MESQEKYIKRDVDDGTSILSVYTRVLRTDTRSIAFFIANCYTTNKTKVVQTFLLVLHENMDEKSYYLTDL